MYTDVIAFALSRIRQCGGGITVVTALLLGLLPVAALLQERRADVRINIDRVASLAGERYGPEVVETVNDWGRLLDGSRSAAIEDKLLATNNFFNNHVVWTPDIRAWGIEDYWATPLESLGRRQGDCEDFSIAKYVTLLALGVAPESLRLVYVKARLASGVTQAHMVLAWYASPRSPPLILDNINPLILSADKRQDLQPVFSFNAQALWLRGGSTRTDASPRARLSRWHQVLERIATEGVSANW